MADQDKDQKTEPATPKRRAEAFKRGQFARSPDVQVAFTLTAALVVMLFSAPDIARSLRDFALYSFQNLGRTTLSNELMLSRLVEAGQRCLGLMTPLLVACFVAAVLGGGAQSRFQLTTEVLEPKLDRLNFVSGFKNIFNTSALMTLPFDLLKLGGIGLALWLAVKRVMQDPLFHVPMKAEHLAQFLNHSTLLFLAWICGAMAIIAIASYSYQHHKTEKDLRMTKQEVRDEHKQQEGDPMVKGHRRRLARRLMQKQMLQAVPTADVVVTNPTHFAVALKYERGKDEAPVIVAKGEGAFARRIKALGAEYGVPMIENKPVARMLFKVGEVGEPVPLALYQAVAEILAFVYRTHRYYFHALRARRAALQS
ncbi:MAG TPA: EscU/YscU/HrcU family type III secretion system export apparatus switch protein [Opitutaceae bacterium]|nr:EscU/YscU/HrcU family type III secretion system export apparatus switch protein [Opitutaceae bacterium]